MKSPYRLIDCTDQRFDVSMGSRLFRRASASTAGLFSLVSDQRSMPLWLMKLPTHLPPSSFYRYLRALRSSCASSSGVIERHSVRSRLDLALYKFLSQGFPAIGKGDKMAVLYS